MHTTDTQGVQNRRLCLQHTQSKKTSKTRENIINKALEGSFKMRTSPLCIQKKNNQKEYTHLTHVQNSKNTSQKAVK